MTQNPVAVSDTQVESERAPASVPQNQSDALLKPRAIESTPDKSTVHEYTLTALPSIAKHIQKQPSSAKKYVGEILNGQAKFVKAPKGNSNSVVADVNIAGLGEVSIWCRNVVGASPTGKSVDFDGAMVGSVYTSEDFSHDVFLKDCRLHEQ